MEPQNIGTTYFVLYRVVVLSSEVTCKVNVSDSKRFLHWDVFFSIVYMPYSAFIRSSTVSHYTIHTQSPITGHLGVDVL